jgi:hypothetical protein
VLALVPFLLIFGVALRLAFIAARPRKLAGRSRVPDVLALTLPFVSAAIFLIWDRATLDAYCQHPTALRPEEHYGLWFYVVPVAAVLIASITTHQRLPRIVLLPIATVALLVFWFLLASLFGGYCGG